MFYEFLVQMGEHGLMDKDKTSNVLELRKQKIVDLKKKQIQLFPMPESIYLF